MLALLLAACLPFAPQQPVTTSIAEAVVVRGDAELSPAEALVSAKRKAEEHVRDLWQDRAEQAFSGRRPFWLPDLLAREAMRRWLAELPIEQMATYVDREDRQREHEFGSSYQTTLWVAEEPRLVANSERLLRRATRQQKTGDSGEVRRHRRWLGRAGRGDRLARPPVARLHDGASAPSGSARWSCFPRAGLPAVTS